MNIYGLNIKTHDAYKKGTELLNYVYLHGAVNRQNEYDLVATTKKACDILESCDHGKFYVNIILHDGTEEQGILYYWTDKNGLHRGLVVSETDEESIEYARWKFDCRANIL